MTNWLAASRRAKSQSSRRKFLRLHQAEHLRDTIKACRSCELNRTRKHPVPFDGKPPKPIAVVGEAPGAAEDKEGKPFVGRSGSLLRQMMEDSGYSRDQAVIMNVVACRPPKNRTPRIDEVEACAPNFDAQLSLSGAWVVLLLGQSALNRIRPSAKIGSVRGAPFWQEGRVWIPTYHPAYLLRNRSVKGVTAADVRLAFDIAYGKKWQPPMLTKPLDTTDGKDLSYALDNQGYAIWDSERLDDRVVVVNDQLVKVPTKHQDLPRYTVEELVRIGELGRGGNMARDTLQRIHLVKKLGGTIVQ